MVYFMKSQCALPPILARLAGSIWQCPRHADTKNNQHHPSQIDSNGGLT